MLSVSPGVSIFLHVAPADLRKSYDGLAGLAREHLERNVLDGGLFVFFNRRRDRVKILYWDMDGLALWTKRLEAGSFQMPRIDSSAREAALSATDLSLILRGIDLTSVKRRKRYQRAAS
jgi:transposase